MTKTLLLFVQSPGIDTYVNALTHCVEQEQVRDIFFVGREALAGQEAELEVVIRKICSRIKGLAEQHPEYKATAQHLPPDKSIKENILRIDFLRPHQAIPKLKQKFSEPDKVIIDITATQKQLAGDTMTSFIANGFEHICSFVFDDKVVSNEWNKGKLYHDLINDEGVTRYTYLDFSKSESTVLSFKELRAQGKWVRLLLALSVVLALLVVILIFAQQTTLAQIVAITSLITVAVGLTESLVKISKFIGGFS